MQFMIEMQFIAFSLENDHNLDTLQYFTFKKKLIKDVINHRVIDHIVKVFRESNRYMIIPISKLEFMSTRPNIHEYILFMFFLESGNQKKIELIEIEGF